MTKQERLDRIILRWHQSHRRQDLMDWHAQTEMLLDMAGSASRFARTTEEKQHADDLCTLAGLSYHRSLEFMPADLSRLPNLMCEAA